LAPRCGVVIAGRFGFPTRAAPQRPANWRLGILHAELAGFAIGRDQKAGFRCLNPGTGQAKCSNLVPRKHHLVD
jgi:hypothetical protein